MSSQAQDQMEPNKDDLIRMLTILEGELQAKEIVISILKTEQVRRLIHPCYTRRRWNHQSYSKLSTNTIIPNNRGIKGKQQHQLDSQHGEQHQQQQLQLPQAAKSNQLNNIDSSDPYIALLRDTYCAYDPTFDENSTKLIYNLQYQHLKNLIEQQRKVRRYLESQISEWESNYKACFHDLENERSRSKQYNREKMIQRIEQLEKENSCLANDLEKVKNDLEKEKEREKSMVMCLITERQELIVRLIEENQRNSELVREMESEKSRIAEMVEGLEEESKRSLQMESELERLSANFEKSRQVFVDKIKSLEGRNVKLEEENDSLRKELETIKSKRIASLGEGVRSTIVTVNSDHKIVPSVTTVAALNQPKLNVAARPLSPSRVANSPVSRPVPIVGQSSSLSSSSPPSTYATIQPVSKSGTNHALPVNTITPAPPQGPPPPLPKVSSAPAAAQATIAFQNMTYSMETPVVASKSPVGRQMLQQIGLN